MTACWANFNQNAGEATTADGTVPLNLFFLQAIIMSIYSASACVELSGLEHVSTGGWMLFLG